MDPRLKRVEERNVHSRSHVFLGSGRPQFYVVSPDPLVSKVWVSPDWPYLILYVLLFNLLVQDVRLDVHDCILDDPQVVKVSSRL